MKKHILLFSVINFAVSCSDSGINNNNPYLPNYTFSINVDSSQASNNNLTFAGNGVIVNQSGAGVRGVFVFNTGSGYTAWDVACPNQTLATCSTMTLSGINAKCPCSNELYSLYTGQATDQTYPLKQYRTEVNGNIIRVYN